MKTMKTTTYGGGSRNTPPQRALARAKAPDAVDQGNLSKPRNTGVAKATSGTLNHNHPVYRANNAHPAVRPVR